MILPKVIIYTVEGCYKCKQVTSYFDQKGILYENVDVRANDKKRAREMIEKSGQKSVPVIEINGQIIVGYQPDEFEKLILNNK